VASLYKRRIDFGLYSNKHDFTFQYPEFVPLWFVNTGGGEEEQAGEEEPSPDRWRCNGQYWKQREHGFHGLTFEPLW
jgi:hypothetical protein